MAPLQERLHHRFRLAALEMDPRVEPQLLNLQFQFAPVVNGGGLVGRSWPSLGEMYELDGVTSVGFSLALPTAMSLGGGGVGPGPGCSDSALNVRAFAEIKATVYRSGPFAGRFSLGSTIWGTAPNKPVVHAFGLDGSTTGWTLPWVPCNKLYIDAGRRTLFFPLVARADGHSTQSLGSIVHNQALEGLRMWLQAAWPESMTGNMMLSGAETTFVPRMPRTYQRRALVQRDPARKASSGVLTGQEEWFPILGYRR